VPLAKEVNGVAVRSVKPSDIAATRQTLLAIIANLAEDEMRLVGKERRPASGGTRRVRRRQPRAAAQADMTPNGRALRDISL